MFMRTQAYYSLTLDIRVVIISTRTVIPPLNDITDCKRKVLDRATGLK